MESIIASSITAVVTLLAVFVSYFLSKKNLQQEIAKLKEQQALSKMQDLPVRAASLLDDINSGMSEKEMKRFLTDVYAYGSPEAIRILVKFQENNYAAANGNQKTDPWFIMSLLSLLICQLKYDLTGRITSPESWFRLKITDYNPKVILAKETLNKLVEDLNLDARFSINEE